MNTYNSFIAAPNKYKIEINRKHLIKLYIFKIPDLNE